MKTDSTVESSDPAPVGSVGTFDETLAAAETLAPAHAGLVETLVADSAHAPANVRDSFGRTAVLPQPDDVVGEPLPARVRYQEVEGLGAGGAGEVFLVRDNDVGRDVAMKRLKASLTNASSILRFAEEVRTVGRLEHPGIVPIYDVGRDEHGALFFIMKRVAGETLADIIAKLRDGNPEYHARYTFKRRAEIFAEVLRALCFAHGSGVLHRDIKPANIMVGSKGEALLMDWGLAKPIGSVETVVGAREPHDRETDPGISSSGARLFETGVGALIGTPAYLSPEQARRDGDAVDVRSDVYALSVVFHELLTLEHYLADAVTLDEVLEGVTSRQLGFLDMQSQRESGVPAEYRHFLVKGMAKRQEDRFQTVHEMFEELQRIKEGRFAIQCPMTFTKRVLHGGLGLVDRHPLGVLLGLVFTTLALIGALVAGVFAVVVN